MNYDVFLAKALVMIKIKFNSKKIFYILTSFIFLLNYCHASSVDVDKKRKIENENIITEKKKKFDPEKIVIESKGELKEKIDRVESDKENVNISENTPTLVDFSEKNLKNTESILMEAVKNNSLKELIILKIKKFHSDKPFGSLVPKEPKGQSLTNEKYQKLEKENREFLNYFSKYTQGKEKLTIAEVIEMTNNYVIKKYQEKEITREDVLKIARIFRHLEDKSHFSKTNQIGDFIAEYILFFMFYELTSKSKIEKKLNPEDSKYLSEICYELSQSYTHLTAFDKIDWKNNQQSWRRENIDKGALKDFAKIELDYPELIQKRLSLLRLSLSLNPNFSPSWTRVIEFYFYEIKEHTAYTQGGVGKKILTDVESFIGKDEGTNTIYFINKWDEAKKWNEEGKIPFITFDSQGHKIISNYFMELKQKYIKNEQKKLLERIDLLKKESQQK